MAAHENLASSSDQVRLKIILLLVAAIGGIGFSTFLWPDNLILNSSASVTITAVVPLVAAMRVIARQKPSGLYGKTYVALTIGIVCWFTGELIWTYDNVVIGKEPTQLSLADIPWLTLYAFFGYYVFKTYHFFGFAINRRHFIAIAAIVTAIIAITIYSILSSLSGSGSSVVVIVRLLYPVGDAVLIVPSILLLITLRHGLLTYTPWLLASVALVLIATADILFTNISTLGAFELFPIAFPLYNAGNLTFAGALLWYNKFGIYDQNTTMGAFQKRNK